MVVGPQVDQMPGELGAIVGKQVLGSPALTHQTVQHFDDMLAPQPLPDLNRQPLAREHVHHRQSPERLTRAERIVDEVEAPGLVWSLRLATGLALNNHLTPSRLLGSRRASPSSR